MPFIECDGGLVHYEEFGEGRPLVVLHGITSCIKYWWNFLEKLPPGIRAVAIDSRGHGYSDPSPRRLITVPMLADDVARVLDTVGVRRAVVMGLSMGGMIAQEFAHRYPQRVSGLVLVDTLPSLELLGWKARIIFPGVFSYLRFVFKPFARFLIRWIEPRLSRAQMETVLDHMYRADHRTLSAIWRGMKPWDSRPWLPEIRCPTLVIVGEEDRGTPPSIARAIHRRIPGSELATIPRAGHASTLERPVEFREALDRFLAEFPPYE